MRAGGAPRRLRASDTAPATPEPTQNQRRTTASRTRAHSRDAAEQSERRPPSLFDGARGDLLPVPGIGWPDGRQLSKE